MVSLDFISFFALFLFLDFLSFVSIMFLLHFVAKWKLLLKSCMTICRTQGLLFCFIYILCVYICIFVLTEIKKRQKNDREFGLFFLQILNLSKRHVSVEVNEEALYDALNEDAVSQMSWMCARCACVLYFVTNYIRIHYRLKPIISIEKIRSGKKYAGNLQI